MAAVHCVIIGFGAFEVEKKTIYAYEDIRGEVHAVAVRNINPYLVDAPNIFLENRSNPICSVPGIGIGSQPIDDGNFLFTTEERDEFLQHEPKAAKWFHRWIGSDEFLNGYERWCLWLGDCPPNELRQMPDAMKRIEAVKRFRLNSKRSQTLKAAATPTHFATELIPTAPYLLIPKVSSERRNFIPLGFMQPDIFCSDLVFMLPHATLYHFGILSSTMHNAWMRTVCGRLESRYRYSAGIVYNNFPWPELPSPAGRGIEGEGASGEHGTASPSSPALPPAGEGSKQRAAVEAAAQAVLDARAQFPQSSLADLYDPLTMPPVLVKAHQTLDRAVDACYRKAAFTSDAQRVEFLFERYRQLTSLLPTEKKTPKQKRRLESNFRGGQ